MAVYERNGSLNPKMKIMLCMKAAIVTEIEHCGKKAEAMSATINTARPLVSTQQLHKERMREKIEKERVSSTG